MPLREKTFSAAVSWLATLAAVLVAAPISLAQRSPEPIGTVFSTNAGISGNVLLTFGGASLLPGATVDAGESFATVQLHRGGTLRICPHTSVAFASAAQSGLLFSLNSGSMEADYALPAGEDTLVTPDFRIVLTAPAQFHVAVKVAANGDTCVRSLAGDNGAVRVSELMGPGVYQVKPGESIFFAAGKIAGARSSAGEECGCGEPPQPALELAKTPTPTPAAHDVEASAAPVPPAGTPTEHAAPQTPINPPQTVVDTAFVFNATEGPSEAAILNLQPHRSAVREEAFFTSAEPAVLPPPQPAPKPSASAAASKAKKPGFFARLGSFFSGLFHRHPKPTPSAG